jgi:hypothetical protein
MQCSQPFVFILREITGITHGSAFLPGAKAAFAYCAAACLACSAALARAIK